MNIIAFKELVNQALKEDLGMGDWSSNWIFSSSTRKKGRFVAKQAGILAGVDVLEQVYEALSGGVSIHRLISDGSSFEKGQVIAEVEGPATVLLSGERVILNILQHLSGIASITHSLVQSLDDASIKVADTRKTLPGLRMIQKYAVRCGGGYNHRFRLDDGIMSKENHISASGGIKAAVERIRAQQGHMIKIEVEVESKEQVLEAVEAGADVIMLDNQSPESVKQMRTLIPSSILVEVSGGIGPDNIASYKGCGADIISVGWITHSVQACDISFYID